MQKGHTFAKVYPFSNIASYIAKGAHLPSKHNQLFWSLKKVCPFSIHSFIQKQIDKAILALTVNRIY